MAEEGVCMGINGGTLFLYTVVANAETLQRKKVLFSV